jgi:hypothetical protein
MCREEKGRSHCRVQGLVKRTRELWTVRFTVSEYR